MSETPVTTAIPEMLQPLEPAPLPPPRIEPTGWDLVKVVAVLWGFALAVGVVSGVLTVIRGPSGVTPNLLQVLTLVEMVMTTALVLHFTCFKYRRTLVDGLALRRPSWRAIVTSVVIAILLAVLASVCAMWGATGSSFMSQLAESKGGLQTILMLAVVAPLVEEMYYRSFIYPVLQRKIGTLAGGFVVVVWFAAAHSFQLAGDWALLIPIFGLSVSTVVQRQVHATLVPGIICHYVYNVGVFIVPPIITLLLLQ